MTAVAFVVHARHIGPVTDQSDIYNYTSVMQGIFGVILNSQCIYCHDVSI